MEREPHIARLMKEGGVIPAPEGLENKIMNRVFSEPQKQIYKPLINRKGRIVIILFIVLVVLLTLPFAGSGMESLEISSWLQEKGLQLPQFHINLSFLFRITPSSGVAAALVALFILVLTDSGLKKRTLI